MKRRPPFRHCLVPGCGAEIEIWRHFCATHWRMLPVHDRAAITEARQRRDLARVYHLASAAASAIAASAVTDRIARQLGERAE